MSDFAATDRRAVDAGCAGVEVHSANGYLLHQFFAPQHQPPHRCLRQQHPLHHRSHRRRTLRTAHLPRQHRQRHHRHRRLLPGPHQGQRGQEPGLPAHRLRRPRPTALRPPVRALERHTLIANPGLPADRIPAEGRRETDEHLLATGADLIALGRPFPANPDLVDRIRTGAPIKAVRAKCDVHRLHRPPTTGPGCTFSAVRSQGRQAASHTTTARESRTPIPGPRAASGACCLDHAGGTAAPSMHHQALAVPGVSAPGTCPMRNAGPHN
ncbi:hypothetical protein ACFVUW_26220 [Streptomyces xiamenensis]|uniref:oxidoreductase n=1 Tax=Streptomyces xiamenensis TaxID=408015 RepID=UPI0036E8624F